LKKRKLVERKKLNGWTEFFYKKKTGSKKKCEENQKDSCGGHTGGVTSGPKGGSRKLRKKEASRNRAKRPRRNTEP